MHNYFNIKLDNEDINKLSSLGLAHLGDAVYELMVRTWLVMHGKCTSQGLHRATVGYVNAPKQAELFNKLQEVLTEEEKAVYKRGRNAKVGSIPKNAEVAQYHSATGLEALFGYLYLHGRIDRINELFDLMMEG